MRAAQGPLDDWLKPVLDGSRGSGGVSYRLLADALRAAIVADRLPVGAQLPTQRELALRLGVGRTTVVSAYNLLRGEELIWAAQGAGTWVAHRPRRTV